MPSIRQLIADHRFVQVTAADFNGTDWDGRPLEPCNPKSTADDLSWAMSRKIVAQSRGGTDYAWFCVKDENAPTNEHWAGPGDYLFHTNDKYNPVVVVPKELMEMLLAADTVSNETLADEEVLRRDGQLYFYGGRSYTADQIQVLQHLTIRGGATSLTDIAVGLGMKVNDVDRHVQALLRANMLKDAREFKVTGAAIVLLASKPELLPGRTSPEPEPKLERSARVHHYVYGGKTFTEGAIRTLVELAKGPGTPSEVAERSGITQTTVVDGMTQLKNSRLIADGDTAFQRKITDAGRRLLESNIRILPD